MPSRLRRTARRAGTRGSNSPAIRANACDTPACVIFTSSAIACCVHPDLRNSTILASRTRSGTGPELMSEDRALAVEIPQTRALAMFERCRCIVLPWTA